MNIMYNNYLNSPYFGQKFPTEAMFKYGLSDYYNFEDAKKICAALHEDYSGRTSFHKRALKCVADIERKNPYIEFVFQKLREIPNKNERYAQIRKLVEKHGENIDVEW